MKGVNSLLGALDITAGGTILFAVHANGAGHLFSGVKFILSMGMITKGVLSWL